MGRIRACHEQEAATIAAIVNAAAEAYRGVIPDDCWHEPYMPLEELQSEIAAGISFWGWDAEGELRGVMGSQPVRDVLLIRHAYVLPAHQREGIGAALLAHVCRLATRRVLVGTWADAHWAIAFYQRHGFTPVPDAEKIPLLKTYWTVPDRQIAASTVLSAPPRHGTA